MESRKSIFQRWCTYHAHTLSEVQYYYNNSVLTIIRRWYMRLKLL